eukprot:XP_001710144.1 Hypothetical protein GL50803_19257 [Giardia lamblia ATCC 50803]
MGQKMAHTRKHRIYFLNLVVEKARSAAHTKGSLHLLLLCMEAWGATSELWTRHAPFASHGCSARTGLSVSYSRTFSGGKIGSNKQRRRPPTEEQSLLFLATPAC